MKYKNPRLKIVKKIEYLCSKVKNDKNNTVTVEMILEQCNLLLETKKKKRCERCAKGFTCYSHGAYPVRPEPSPQPEIEKFKEDEFVTGRWYWDLEARKKINLLIDQLNKLTKTK